MKLVKGAAIYAGIITVHNEIEVGRAISMIENAMPKRAYHQGLLPPSKAYPRWMQAGGKELIYLAWGERRFDRDPLPVHSNNGWVYWLVTSGQVLVEFEDETRLYRAGTGMLAGPELAFGFPCVGQQPSRILAWIWKSPPPAFPKAGRTHCESLEFNDQDIDLLADLHRQCRHECLNTDELSSSMLPHLHGVVDGLFARASRQQSTVDRKQAQFQQARQWMLEHLEANRPVEALARYLNMAPITLHRLFTAVAGESPGAHFRRLKMERAKELLAQRGYSIKHAAYELGYRHPGDFSRAYQHYWKARPSQR